MSLTLGEFLVLASEAGLLGGGGGGGSGTVTSIATGAGLAGGPITSTGTIALLVGTANAVMVSDGSKNPSFSTTLPAGLTIPGYPKSTAGANAPNGNVAGTVGDLYTSTGTIPLPVNSFWQCVTTGTASTAVWKQLTSPWGFMGTNNGYGVAGGNTVNGTGSLSFGVNCIVNTSSTFSFAFGNACQTNGAYTWAIGNQAATANLVGAVCWGDSNATPPISGVNNSWTQSFAGGYRYFVGSSGTTSVLATSISALGDFITNQGVAEQGSSFQTPVTGFSITLLTKNHLTTLTPAGTLATGTIILPTPTIDGQRLKLVTTQAITALTVTPTGSNTIVGAPTTLAANSSFEMRYNLAGATWYPYAVPSVGGGTSGPIVAGQTLGSAIGGDGTAVASGNYAFAYGINTTTAGLGSFAFGDGAVASGIYSFALGQVAPFALGICSFAMGNNNEAGGNYSFSFGLNSIATAAYSWAIGNSPTALNAGSVVWTGSVAPSSGFTDTQSNQFNLFFQGGYNFFTGVGTGANQMVNTFAIDQNFNAVFNHGIVENNYTVQVPVTGFSFTPVLGSGSTPGTHLTIFKPAGTLATGTIVLPQPTSTATSFGCRLSFSTTQTITALTVSSAGSATILGAPTTLGAGQSFEMIWDLSSNTWYPYIGSSTATSSVVTSSPAITVNGVTTVGLTGTYNNAAAGVGATFTMTATGTLLIDSNTVLLNNLYLFRTQSSSFQNGVYICTVAPATGVQGVFTRATNYNTPALINGTALITAIAGSINVNAIFALNTPVVTIGTSNLNFVYIPQFSSGPAANTVVQTLNSHAILLASNNLAAPVFTGTITENGGGTQTPVSGFSITLSAASHETTLIPAGTLATGTIVMPVVTSANNGLRLRVSTTQTITALTVSPDSGHSILAAPTTLAAGAAFEMYYDNAITTWLPY